MDRNLFRFNCLNLSHLETTQAERSVRFSSEFVSILKEEASFSHVSGISASVAMVTADQTETKVQLRVSDYAPGEVGRLGPDFKEPGISRAAPAYSMLPQTLNGTNAGSHDPNEANDLHEPKGAGDPLR